MKKKRGIKDIKLFLLDLDGTVYLGDRLIEGASEFIEAVRERGRRVVFLTNNSSRSRRQYIEKLTGMGIECGAEDVYISSDAALKLLVERYGGKRVFVLGTQSLTDFFSEGGVNITERDPEVVVVGYDTELTYRKLCTATTALRRGAAYIVTHSDINCPAYPEFVPDAGSIIALIGESTGRRPQFDCGKPYVFMGESISERYGFVKEEVAMVGDRLYTDIKFGLNNGFFTVLTLSGETDAEAYERSGLEADLVVESIGKMTEML